MKEMDKIEKHVAKTLSKKAVIGASNTNKRHLLQVYTNG
jgi:hypothetical protein